MTGRAVPFHCPYCGDQDLRPHEGPGSAHGAWECRSCLRAFKINMIGQLRHPSSTHMPAPSATSESAPAPAPGTDGRR